MSILGSFNIKIFQTQNTGARPQCDVSCATIYFLTINDTFNNEVNNFAWLFVAALEAVHPMYIAIKIALQQIELC